VISFVLPYLQIDIYKRRPI